MRKCVCDLEALQHQVLCIECGVAGGKAGSGAGKVPVKECEQGRKWVIENFVEDTNVVVSDTNPKQAVYISNCKNSVIKAMKAPLSNL